MVLRYHIVILERFFKHTLMEMLSCIFYEVKFFGSLYFRFHILYTMILLLLLYMNNHGGILLLFSLPLDEKSAASDGIYAQIWHFPFMIILLNYFLFFSKLHMIWFSGFLEIL